MKSNKFIFITLLILNSIFNMSHAKPIKFNCKGWAPLYLDSWVPVNPDPTDTDFLSIHVDDETKIVRFDLALIGRISTKMQISSYSIKARIPFRRAMVDDLMHILDFNLNRPSGEITITVLERSRKGHNLFKGKCKQIKSTF